MALAVAAVLLVLTACGGGNDDGDAESPTTTAATTSSLAASTDPVDPTRLPIGDGKVASAAAVGQVFSCRTTFGGGGAFRDGPWIKTDGTFDLTAKVEVDGAVEWPGETKVTREGARRIVTANAVPGTYATGTFPVASTDDAYQYDRNPNAIKVQSVTYSVPADPAPAASPSCLDLGAIAVTTDGVAIFNALDALGRDAVAHEVQDGCDGHPERSGLYHHHSLTDCLTEPEGTGHSELVAYAMDGFGLYGHRGVGGREVSNADLDECHGHTHEIEWDGASKALYHYHATREYPYTLGCYRGTPEG